jgi:quinoprotein glucose dehydrogenase
MLRANADRDVHLRHAAVMGLAGTREPEKLAAAAQDSSAAVRMGILLAWRRLESPGLAVFLEDREPRLVLEAARAIHDVPIAAALPRLARLPLERGVEEALARRVLNANFRLGGGENAAAVARAAGAEELPEAVRVEALQELADWARPSGRDRVLGAWRPLAPRGAEAAAAALQPPLPRILAAAPNAVRAAAVETAARLSMRSAGEDLHRILASGREPGADSQGVRAAALRALESLGDARLLEAARAAAFDGEPDVRREGQRLLARLSPAEAIPALESALERGTTFERQGALAALADLREPAAGAILSRWMDSLLAGTAPAELQLDILEAAARQGSAELAEKAAKHESAKPGDDPVAEYREALAGGDARKGKVLFHEKAQVSCQRCHRAESIGGEVGPNLAGIGAREKRDYLLESLVAPNAKIARGFDTVVLATRTGEVYTGVLKEEDEARVKLLSPEGTLLTVEKDALAARAGGVSAMPEDVRKFLTKREIRDLVEYLASLK